MIQLPNDAIECLAREIAKLPVKCQPWIVSLILGGFAVLVTACGSASPAARTPAGNGSSIASEPVARRLNLQQDLILELTAETRSVTGDEPLWVTYRLRNVGERARTVRLQPLNLQLVILTPSGREAPFDEWEEPPLLYKEADFFLPVDGFIGRRVNLRCGATWFARTSPLGKDGCGWAFEFPETGDYRVVLRYNMAAGSGENPPVVLESDTLVISVRNR